MKCDVWEQLHPCIATTKHLPGLQMEDSVRLSALAKQQVLASGKQLMGATERHTKADGFFLLSSDEGAHDREFTRGWNSYVRGEDWPEVATRDFLEGCEKASREYGGRTMKTMIEVEADELG